jgi:apolipoprotein N-acyltransferase
VSRAPIAGAFMRSRSNVSDRSSKDDAHVVSRRAAVRAPTLIKPVTAIAAGAALPLAFAPFDLFWIAPLSYAVLFFVWRGARPGAAFWRGFVFGAAAFLAGTYWTYISIHDFGDAPVALASFLTGGLVAAMACFVGVSGWVAARWLGTEGPYAWFGILPAVSVLTEWCRGWFLTGFGWLSAGYSQTESWLMAYAPLLGVHGISWLVFVSAGALVAVCLTRARVRAQSLAVIVVIWGAGFALTGQRWSEPKGELLTVALVQGAVPQELKWQPEQLNATLALYRRLTREAGDSELIVWPEAAIPALYEQVERYLDDVRAAAAAEGATIMLGILKSHPQSGTFQNALVALTEPPAVYVKRHLVPFGEYFPVPSFMRRWMRLMSLPYVDAVPGAPRQPPLELVGERIAVTICYEDVFGAEQLHSLPEATLLVNVSNDAWFGDSIAPHQHLQIARLRAAEAGRYLLRSTNTGISAIIDPSGAIVRRLPQFEPGILRDAVQGFTGATPYSRWGNYPIVIGAVAVAAFAAVRRRRAAKGNR